MEYIQNILSHEKQEEAKQAILFRLYEIEKEYERLNQEKIKLISSLRLIEKIENHLTHTSVYGEFNCENTKGYSSIAIKAMLEYNTPITTLEVIGIIENVKGKLFENKERAKINVASSLSRDSRIKNICWKNGKAWWLAEKEIPYD